MVLSHGNGERASFRVPVVLKLLSFLFGALLVTMCMALRTLDIPVRADQNVSLPQVWQYSHVSALTTTTPKSVAGTLHSIVVNASGSVPCFVIVYDSATASGSQIASVDCAGKGQLTYDVSFTTGLTVVTTSTATPASAPDVTVTYQ